MAPLPEEGAIPAYHGVMDKLFNPLVDKLRVRNRLLLAHSLICIEVGIFMILTGAPVAIEETFGPWARVALGGQAILPGIVVLIGLALGLGSTRGRWVTVIGLLGQATWHAIMMASLTLSVVQKSEVLALGEPLRPGGMSAYPAWIYMNLALLVIIHIVDIVKSERQSG